MERETVEWRMCNHVLLKTAATRRAPRRCSEGATPLRASEQVRHRARGGQRGIRPEIEHPPRSRAVQTVGARGYSGTRRL